MSEEEHGGISREQDEDGRRWYVTDDSKGLSVTTILDLLEEDTTGLEIWKSRNDGEGDNPWWEHLFWYSGHRGTLCHYQALKAFEDVFDGGVMWGKEESESMQAMMEGPADDAFDDMSDRDVPTDEKEVVYSLLKKRGVVSDREQFFLLLADSTSLLDVVTKDIEYFVETFGTVCEKLGIQIKDVISVEKYMVHSEVGYGGQTDLVYEDASNGDIVVADLKTSGSFRQKHRLQAVAYAKGIEDAEDILVNEVDRVEIVRINPDDEVWEVLSSTVPSHFESLEQYDDEDFLKDPWGDFEYESLDDMWETFVELSEKAHDQ